MRVEHHLKTETEQLNRNRNQPTAERPFADVMMDSRNRLSKERLNRLLTQINDKGHMLTRQRTLRHLREYKQLVQEFMEECVQHGLALKQTNGWNHHGRPKVYRIVELVDEKLVALTEEILEGEQSGLRIMELVGEIKGMLLDMHM